MYMEMTKKKKKKSTFWFSLSIWRPLVKVPRIMLLEQMEKAHEAELGNRVSRNGVCVTNQNGPGSLPCLCAPHPYPTGHVTPGHSQYLLISHLLLETPFFHLEAKKAFSPSEFGLMMVSERISR